MSDFDGDVAVEPGDEVLVHGKERSAVPYGETREERRKATIKRAKSGGKDSGSAWPVVSRIHGTS